MGPGSRRGRKSFSLGSIDSYADEENALQLRDSRFVIDKTGLTGLYDVQDSVIDVGPSNAEVNLWPQIMEYLGFKLEATRGPIESLVIDQLERPTEN
jgi:uncharacterized protein (TIGR03435 family)